MGYQKKHIDLLNSTKLILGLSDVPYAQNQRKWRKTAKNCFTLGMLVHKNPGDNPEVRYIEFLLMDSGSELSPEQDPVVWKILNFGHFALNNAN